MSILTKTILLLTISNLFMLTAWYFHLKQWSDKPWYIAAFLSWCIAAIEYSVHIPANRIGHTVLSLSQLQILQVGMSLLLFIPFAILVMKAPIRIEYFWASCCLIGAAVFIFRGVSATQVSADQSANRKIEISTSDSNVLDLPKISSSAPRTVSRRKSAG